MWGRSSVVEQLALNQFVLGSNPSALTKVQRQFHYFVGNSKLFKLQNQPQKPKLPLKKVVVRALSNLPAFL